MSGTPPSDFGASRRTLVDPQQSAGPQTYPNVVLEVVGTQRVIPTWAEQRSAVLWLRCWRGGRSEVARRSGRAWVATPVITANTKVRAIATPLRVAFAFRPKLVAGVPARLRPCQHWRGPGRPARCGGVAARLASLQSIRVPTTPSIVSSMCRSSLSKLASLAVTTAASCSNVPKSNGRRFASCELLVARRTYSGRHARLGEDVVPREGSDGEKSTQIFEDLQLGLA